ncbi:HD-GYP domain-containing protein [Chromobacterium phragmitis]|uniref:HD-GYP domain-containing protein n=1 Tax=Chromobacterium amazonense TaxID=1382803 RepID=UPI00058369B9|nr:HD-GYP domain-containing protein [Chromobacterium amazonense]KIA80960.1 metal-dependent phosphohydrolase [Chromobacterium piscinae]MBM2883457.1 HD-GYP domain-containing protein [Chromobacterium amazonense]
MTQALKLSQLIGSLSYALDITEGQPEGHCVRSCWIGMHIGRAIGLSPQELWDLYYTILLKDLGCSSNAARICELYLTDDRDFKQDFKRVGASLPQMLGFVFANTGTHAAGWRQRAASILNVLRRGKEMADELINTRCHRGADIARQLRFNENVARGIQYLDEHWDGSGRPLGLSGQAIPLNARIALLSQVIDVFNVTHGRHAALDEAVSRGGGWFDPELVAAFRGAASDDGFWRQLESDDIEQAVLELEPAQFTVPLDEDYMDEIAEGFGQVVDSKSPFTAGHSHRVGHYADRIGMELGLDPQRRRWLKRGALLHDVGKLGVSNTILDKPGKLTPEEWEAVKRHAAYTETILGRIESFAELARVAGAHHERLDGTGYPRGLMADQIALETRIITVADIFDAIHAARPYHPENPVPVTLDIMRQSLGSALDPRCFAALEGVLREEDALESDLICLT